MKKKYKQPRQPIAVVEPASGSPGWSKRALTVDPRSLAERWEIAGQKLELYDMKRFEHQLTMAEAYVSTFEPELETDAEFQGRLALVMAQAKALAKRRNGDQGGN